MRPTWDEYFTQIVNVVRTRSTCLRAQHGAVAVKGSKVLATAYNGPPRGMPHCDVCAREVAGAKPGERYELCNAIHAEQNLICQAAHTGVSLEGATVYITGIPCWLCARMLVNSHIQAVRVTEVTRAYDKATIAFMIEAGIEVEILNSK